MEDIGIFLVIRYVCIYGITAIFYGHYICWSFWNIFPFWYFVPRKNLAILYPRSSRPEFVRFSVLQLSFNDAPLIEHSWKILTMVIIFQAQRHLKLEGDNKKKGN
jgi:hypothetical protein